MTSPDPKLMARFGTHDVYEQKLAGFAPFGVRAAMGLLNMELSRQNMKEEEELRLQAQLMNQQIRDAQAMLMRPVEARMRHTLAPTLLRASAPGSDPDIDLGMNDDLGLGPAMQRGPRLLQGREVPVGFDEGMIRMASALGRELVYVDLDAMQKQAEGEPGLFNSLGNAVKSTVRGLGQAGMRKVDVANKGIERGIDAVAGAPSKAKAFGVGKLQSAKGQVQGGLDSFANRMEAFGKGVTYTPPNKLPAGKLSLPQQSPGVKTPGLAPKLEQPATTSAPIATAQPPQALPHAQPAGKLMAPGEVASKMPAAQPAAPGTSSPSGSLGDTLQKAWERSGMSNRQWQWKVPLLAGGLLGAYGLYRGAKGIAGMMSRENAPYNYNQGGANPAYGVNEYGVPDRSTPFTQ